MKKEQKFTIRASTWRAAYIALLMFVFSMTFLTAFAQNRTIQGKVIDDATDEPVIGANVVEKGRSSNGTTTDADGNFTLTVPEKATLVVSYNGYKPLEVSALSGGGVKP